MSTITAPSPVPAPQPLSPITDDDVTPAREDAGQDAAGGSAGGAGTGLAGFAALLAAQAVSAADPEPEPEWPKKESDFDGDLIVFSTLAQAQKYLGEHVTTRFFQKTDDGAGTVALLPLRRQNAASVDIMDVAGAEPTYSPAGTAFAYTPALIKPDMATFAKLHSQDQTAIILLSGELTPGGKPALEYLDGDGAPALTAVLSADMRRAFVVQDLDKTKFANMRYADQLAISQTQAFADIKNLLGVGATKDEILALIDGQLQALGAAFAAKLPTTTVLFPGEDPATRLTLDDRVGFFTEEHLKLFQDQMALVRSSVETNLAIYNKQAIADRLAAIAERFDRALAFGNLPVHASDLNDPAAAVRLVGSVGTRPDGSNTGPTAYMNLVSLDSNRTVKAGFDMFIEQETIRLNAEQEVAKLLQSLHDPDPDVPPVRDAAQLTFRLQLYYNIINETDINSISEEVRQRTDLVQSYTGFQEAVAATTRGVSVTSGSGTVKYLGLGTDRHPGAYTADEILVSSMFQEHAGAAGARAPKHPIEVLRGIERPYFDVFAADGQANAKPLVQWSELSSRLKETVTIIGQDIQQKTNAATEREKEKSRNYELANEVNSAVYELIRDLSSMGF